MKTIKVNTNIRQKTVVVFLLFLFSLVVIKLVYIQIFKHSATNRYVENIVNKETVEHPKRGSILDRNGNILAMSVKKYTLFLDAKMISDFDELEKILKANNIQVTDKHRGDIKNRKSYIPVAYNLDEYAAMQIEAKKIQGIGLEYKYVRQYPEGKMLSHVLGIVSSKGAGLEGIEKICDQQLSGEEIRLKQYAIGSKKIFAGKVVDEKSFAGSDVYLTIDKKLQFILEQELEKGFKSTQAKKAIGIIQNPRTGDILAMASLPDYYPGLKIPNLEVLRNTAISDVLEPGSTFKVVSLAGALEEKIFRPTDKINCENGRMQIYDEIIRDHDKQGIITVSQVIEYSSNIGTAKIALALGKERFYKYIKIFGFNSRTGIELNGEEIGILRNPSKWSGRSLHTISFGQEIATTSIQIINAFSSIANGGMLLKPQVIKSIDNYQAVQNNAIRRTVSEETAKEVRKILKSVVDNGTGKSAKIPGYTVGGKTGTAQKRDPVTHKYSRKYYVASFCGMIPAENPELVILILFDEPEGQYYASSVAAPVFARIAQRAAQHLQIPKDDDNISKTKIKKRNI